MTPRPDPASMRPSVDHAVDPGNGLTGLSRLVLAIWVATGIPLVNHTPRPSSHSRRPTRVATAGTGLCGARTNQLRTMPSGYRHGAAMAIVALSTSIVATRVSATTQEVSDTTAAATETTAAESATTVVVSAVTAQLQT